jgi:hypothetical protein
MSFGHDLRGKATMGLRSLRIPCGIGAPPGTGCGEAMAAAKRRLRQKSKEDVHGYRSDRWAAG